MAAEQTHTEAVGEKPSTKTASHEAPQDETHQEEGASQATTSELPFDAKEMAQLGQEDAQAGGNIGTMLAIFFLYTVIVMLIVAWWTYGSSVQ